MMTNMRIRSFVAALAGVFALVAGMQASTPSAQAAGINEQLFAGGLNWPAGFTFAPDGRVFYGERFTGEIHILSADGQTDSPFFTIPSVVTNGEQGLLGIALDPNYPSTPYVYAFATRDISGQEFDQIVKIHDNAGTGDSMSVIYTSPTASGTYHDGGRILFGPDGKLWAVQGEAHHAANAQDLSITAGKVLRMNTNGSAPNDNPFNNKIIWSYGLRNSFGFDFDPQTGNLWETENGPSCNDEVNRIMKGRNYGWGSHQTCLTPPAAPRNTNQDGPKPVLPKLFYTPTVAPVGAAFCDACGLGPKTSGRFFFAEYNTGRLIKVRLNAARTGVAAQTTVFNHSGMVSIETAPDGSLYFSDDSGIYKLI
jgi:glucose/arabinose dehydrogenase